MSRLVPLLVVALLLAALVFGALWYYGTARDSAPETITSFEDCAAAGYPVMESYPPQCRTPDGRTFVQSTAPSSATDDLIRVTSPQPGQTVGDPFTVAGEARGTWFFEASFPIHLTTPDGMILATAVAQTPAEWMTEDFIPFTVEFDVPDSVSGDVLLVLEKENPADLPEHASEVHFPITVAR